MFCSLAQLERIDGIPTLMYNHGEPTGPGLVLNCMYTAASNADGSGWSVPVELTDLYDIDNRILTSIDGRMAVISNYDPVAALQGTLVHLNSSPGPGFGSFSKTFIPTGGNTILSGLLRKSPTGNPWILLCTDSGWRYLQSTTAQGSDPAEWNLQTKTTTQGYATGFASAPNASCVELSDEVTAIAYGTGGGTGAKQRYAVYY
jgi:hypothetical protein